MFCLCYIDLFVLGKILLYFFFFFFGNDVFRLLLVFVNLIDLLYGLQVKFIY